jgi:hypothetical protein
MPQHVGMNSERHFGGRPEPRHHPAKGNRRHRRAAFAHEDISSGFLLAPETAQGAKFGAGLKRKVIIFIDDGTDSMCI